tara:strand:- start:433 stop:621 length:189 start_codon:yes stop_codon:yes gene_type:complete
VSHQTEWLLASGQTQAILQVGVNPPEIAAIVLKGTQQCGLLMAQQERQGRDINHQLGTTRFF